MENENQFRRGFDSLLEGIQVIDFNWRYVYLNDVMTVQSKASKEELLGYTIMEKFPGIEHTEVFFALQKTMADRKNRRFENKFVYPDKSVRWFDLHIQPADEGLCVLSLDITDHKLSEARYSRGKDLYAFLSHINQTIVQSSDEQQLFGNACKIAIEFGKFKIGWIGIFNNNYQTVSLVEHCGILDEEIPNFANVTTSKDSPMRHVLKTGKYFLCNDISELSHHTLQTYALERGIQSFIILPLYKSGKIFGTFSLYSENTHFGGQEEILLLQEITGDISFALNNFERERKHRETEQIVFENEKRFRALIEKSADMKTLATAQGKLLYGSPSITKVLGYDLDRMMHASLYTLIHPEDLRVFTKKRKALIKKPGTSIYFEVRMKHLNGSWIWCSGIATNMLEESGVNAIVSNFRDISERKSAEHNRELDRIVLENQNRELTKTNFELDRFVYSVSHDLRSPLTSILGLLSLIEQESQEPDTLEHAAMIKSSVNRLDGFIKNILSYSRNNRTQSEVTYIPLYETTRAIVATLCNIPDAEGIDFTIAFSEKTPFYSDHQSIKTILENIISNAIKFQRKESPQRFIKITGNTSEDYTDIVIADNGCGILEAHQDKIFDMFFRSSAKIDGSGIGLYIVKEIIHKLQGEIVVESQVGKGTTFHIRLKNLNHE